MWKHQRTAFQKTLRIRLSKQFPNSSFSMSGIYKGYYRAVCLFGLRSQTKSRSSSSTFLSSDKQDLRDSVLCLSTHRPSLLSLIGTLVCPYFCWNTLSSSRRLHQFASFVFQVKPISLSDCLRSFVKLDWCPCFNLFNCVL